MGGGHLLVFGPGSEILYVEEFFFSINPNTVVKKIEHCKQFISYHI
jgi:hypothetical protein